MCTQSYRVLTSGVGVREIWPDTNSDLHLGIHCGGATGAVHDLNREWKGIQIVPEYLCHNCKCNKLDNLRVKVKFQ